MTTAIILAGGMGTRLKSVVSDVPKPMAPIDGRPFLEYQMDYWIAQGISRFVLSVGYKYEMMVEHFGGRYRNASIDYVIEKKPLGTGGALLLAIEALNENESFLLLNGDTYFEVGLKYLIAYSEKNNTDWTFSLFRANEKGRYMGMETSKNGKILSLNAGGDGYGNLANGGVYWVNSSALSNAMFATNDCLSLEYDVFPKCFEMGQRMFGVEIGATFIDIGIPDDYSKASELLGAC